MKEMLPIRNESAYEAAVLDVRRLWGAEPDTVEGNRLDVLLVLVDDYENKNHAINPPEPIEAIGIRMEAMELERADLCAMLRISSRRLPEILNRRRRLTIEMMRIPATELKLSESCLLRPYDLVPPSGGPGASPSVRKMQNRRLAA